MKSNDHINKKEKQFDSILTKKLNQRIDSNAFRKLVVEDGLIDFCSNDYLGFSKNKILNENIKNRLTGNNGSGGSRLLAGNTLLAEETELACANFFDAEASLLFNSGYDANLGLFSCLGQKDTFIIYDELAHASIRDGIRLSLAKSYSFKHNDINDLEKKLKLCNGPAIVAIESVYSMDGDFAPLTEIIKLKQNYNFELIVDEAHATGVLGKGLIDRLAIKNEIYARVHTFGKAMGVHGAVIVGSELLKNYLINYARSFIYSTSPSPYFYISIQESLKFYSNDTEQQELLGNNISYFNEVVKKSKLQNFTLNHSAIQTIIIPGNDAVRAVSLFLSTQKINVKPILSPTVPNSMERLRVCLHSFNTSAEIDLLIEKITEKMN